MTEISTKKLYQWHSEVLKNYREGYIIVIASSVEEARKVARYNFQKFASERWDWLFDPAYELDSDDLEERAEKLDLLEKDIAKEPITSEAFYISGSE